MATVTTVQDGDLFDAATFGGALPLTTDDVVVQHLVTMIGGASLTYNSLTFQARDASHGGRLAIESGDKTLTLAAGMVQEGAWGQDPRSGYALAYCAYIGALPNSSLSSSLTVNGDITIHCQGLATDITNGPAQITVNGSVTYTGRDNTARIAATGLDGAGVNVISGDLICTAGIDSGIVNLFSAATLTGTVTVGGYLDGRLGVALVIPRGGADGTGLHLSSWDQVIGPYAIVAGNSSDFSPNGIAKIIVDFPNGRHIIGKTGSLAAGPLSFPVQLGHTDTGKALADYTLQVWDANGATVSVSGATWAETGHGGYRVTVPAYYSNGVGTYHLALTADATKWFAGSIPILSPPTTAAQLRGAVATIASDAAANLTATSAAVTLWTPQIDDAQRYSQMSAQLIRRMTEDVPGGEPDLDRRFLAQALVNAPAGGGGGGGGLSVALLVVPGTPSTKRVELLAATGGTYAAKVVRAADGYLLDFADGSFRATPATPAAALAEVGTTGRYLLDESGAAWQDGVYSVIVLGSGGAVLGGAFARLAGDLAAPDPAGAGLLEYALTDLTSARAEIGLPAGETAEDALLVPAINAATEMVEGACSRRIKKRAASLDLYLDNDAMGEANEILLPEWPVVQSDILELWDDASGAAPVSIPSSDYFVWNDRYLVLKPSAAVTAFTEGPRAVRVVFTPGRIAPLDDLASVARNRTARRYWSSKGQQAGTAEETTGSGSTKLTKDAFEPWEQAIIDRYKRLTVREEVKRRDKRVP